MSDQTRWQRRVHELRAQGVDWLAGRVAAQEELEDKIVALVAGGRIAALEAENARLREALGEAIKYVEWEREGYSADGYGGGVKLADELLTRLRAAL